MADISPLRRRMIEDMTVRNLSPATQRSYLYAVTKFSRYFGRSPDRLEMEDVRAFQVHLVSTGISWPALNQTVCALRFFYGVTLERGDIPERISYAREPRKLPIVLSADEVIRFLEAVPSLKARAALTTAYAAGLRASEATHLKVADVDSARMVMRVEQGKGGKQISAETGVSRSTVSRILSAVRLSRARDLDPPAPVMRYEREHPGELIHLDIKKLGRFEQVGHRITGDRTRQSNSRGVRGGKAYGAGWEYVHVCIDDASRIAFSQIHPDEKKESAIACLEAALAYYASLGVSVTRVMTDNGACYKSFAFRDFCRERGLKHIRTRPYTPKTNGKAERFIQTSLREWAYAKAYPTSDDRAAELRAWLHRYNWHRPHGGINSATPISRIGLGRDNLLSLHI